MTIAGASPLVPQVGLIDPDEWPVPSFLEDWVNRREGGQTIALVP